MDLDRLKEGSQVAAPTVSASMATAALAYSGITVKMLVDQRLDAQLLRCSWSAMRPAPSRTRTTTPSRSPTTCSRARST